MSKSSSSNEEDDKENPLTQRQRTVTDDLYVRNGLKQDYQKDLEDEYMNKSDNKAHS